MQKLPDMWDMKILSEYVRANFSGAQLKEATEALTVEAERRVVEIIRLDKAESEIKRLTTMCDGLFDQLAVAETIARRCHPIVAGEYIYLGHKRDGDTIAKWPQPEAKAKVK